MTFNNGPYEAIGVAIAEELFKQAEELFPIDDEATHKKPSLLKRFVQTLRTNGHAIVDHDGLQSRGDDCVSPKPI